MQRKVLEQKVGRGIEWRISEAGGKQCQTSPWGKKYCVQLKAGTPNDRKS